MVERLNLKLGIDYLPSRAALPAVNRVTLPIATRTPWCVSTGRWDPPSRAKGLLTGLRGCWRGYRVFLCLLDPLAGELEPLARRDDWAEILLSRFG